MPATRDTTQTCPICNETELAKVRCPFDGCAFCVTTCPRCDREQAVAAFVADHMKDCAHGPGVLASTRPATFQAPRSAA